MAISEASGDEECGVTRVILQIEVCFVGDHEADELEVRGHSITVRNEEHERSGTAVGGFGV